MNLHMPVADIERLIASLTRGFARAWSISEDDAKQEAWLAVCDAARLYDPSKGHPGPLYQTAIARALRWLFVKNSSTVRGSLHRPPAEPIGTNVYDELAADETHGTKATVGAAVASVGMKSPEQLVTDASWRSKVLDRLAYLGAGELELAVLLDPAALEQVAAKGGTSTRTLRRKTSAVRRQAGVDDGLRALLAEAPGGPLA